MAKRTIPKPIDVDLVSEYVIENMRQWRKLRGWSQAALDREIGWNKGTAQAIEVRRAIATPRRLALMANAFKIPIAALLSETARVHHTPPGGRRPKQTSEK